jgi:hypothetical protein
MLRIHIFAAAALLVFSGPALADYVGGLDPDGDNYLSLRSGPGSKYDELRRMGPDTVVTIIEKRAGWRRVQLEDGTEGWAFGKYIRRGLPAGATETAPPSAGFQPDEEIGGGVLTSPPDSGEVPPEPPVPASQEHSAEAAVDVDGIMRDIARGLDEAP